MNHKLTSYQAVVLTGYTGTLMCSFSTFQADVEARLQRPITRRQFDDEKFAQQIKEMYEEEFMALISILGF